MLDHLTKYHQLVEHQQELDWNQDKYENQKTMDELNMHNSQWQYQHDRFEKDEMIRLYDRKSRLGQGHPKLDLHELKEKNFNEQ
jgi:phosphoribosylaminoimidazole carboxylase (NCAIR synthetase)